MSWIQKKAGEIIAKRFHKLEGIMSAVFLLITTVVPFYSLIPSGYISFFAYCLFILVIILVILLYWCYYVWYFPKPSKRKLGFVIAVYVEEYRDNNYFLKDFVEPLKGKIDELSLPFNVLRTRNHQSEKILSENDARELLRKTKSHFCIWGSIKRRKNKPDGEKYLFSIRGIVVHKPVQEAQKILLAKEFTELLPMTLEFQDVLQFEYFMFRTDQVFVALDYICGRAALLSGDPYTAIKLHEALYIQMEKGVHVPIPKNKLREILSLEYDTKATFEFFSSPRNAEFINSIQKALEFNPNNYGTLLKRAIIEFDFGKGDPRAAMHTIHLAKKHSYGFEWLYSKAFLHFWMDEYEKALKCCTKLKKVSYPGEEFTVKEVIKFNEELLIDQIKPQLYYWLGFVLYEKEKNLSLADKYFQLFIDRDESSMKSMVPTAINYLSEIKKEIGYS